MDASSSIALILAEKDRLQSKLEEEQKASQQRLIIAYKRYNNVVSLLEKSKEDTKHYKYLSALFYDKSDRMETEWKEKIKKLQCENKKIKMDMKDKLMEIREGKNYYKQSWDDMMRIQQEQNEEIERLKGLITINVNRYETQLKGIVKQQKEYVTDGLEKLERFKQINDSLSMALSDSKKEIERLKSIIRTSGLTEGDIQDSDI